MTVVRDICLRLLGLAGGVVLMAGCGGSDGGGNTTGPQPAPMSVTVTTSREPPARFLPASVRVAVGGTVSWQNTSPAPVLHNVVVTAAGVVSPDLSPNQIFQATFPEAGSYTYNCAYHAGMVGTVTVE